MSNTPTVRTTADVAREASKIYQALEEKKITSRDARDRLLALRMMIDSKKISLFVYHHNLSDVGDVDLLA